MHFAALTVDRSDLGSMLVALALSEGSASHPFTHSAALNAGPLATRNSADLLHLLSLLHGRQPGLIEIAAEINLIPEADDWFRQAASGFAVERDNLAQLIVAAGPAPGTPGEAETAATLLAQRHALETIARSERVGCAIGATAAFLLDWQAIRAVLDTMAQRIGQRLPQSILPDEEQTSAMLAALPDRPRLERTLAFGARQLLAQHHGLWDLLETRAGARMQ